MRFSLSEKFPNGHALADESAAPIQRGDSDGPARILVPFGREADRFERGHDLAADASGGLRRAVETAIEQHQALARYGGVRALCVEVDEAAGVRAAFSAYLGLAAVTVKFSRAVIPAPRSLPARLARRRRCRVNARVPVYDTGMLIALADRKAKAVRLHESLKAIPHRAIVPGPVLGQVWRPAPSTVHALATALRDCTVPHARSSSGALRPTTAGQPVCLLCSTAWDLAE